VGEQVGELGVDGRTGYPRCGGGLLEQLDLTAVTGVEHDDGLAIAVVDAHDLRHAQEVLVGM
jgi:hypothetical protein